MKYVQMILFFLVVVIIYFAMHYYVAHRIIGFFSKSNKILLVSLVMTLTFPIMILFDRFFHSTATRTLYYAASVWMGFVFITLCTLLIFELINVFYPVFHKAAFGIALLGITIAITIYSIINAANITIKDVEINNFGKNMTAVQLSDIHIGTIKNSQYLSRIVKKTNELNPDVIFITGDLFDGSGKITKDTIKPLTELKAPTYFIMGNHEFYEGEDRVAELLKSTNITVLRNNITTFNGVQIIGLDYSENKTYVAVQLEKLKIDSSKPSVLLNHVPLGYNDAKEKGIRLELSGHTHGGQIFPFSIATKIAFPKNKGLYTFENDSFSIYVSQGTGTWGPPMRLGTRSEITLIHLKK